MLVSLSGVNPVVKTSKNDDDDSSGEEVFDVAEKMRDFLKLASAAKNSKKQQLVLVIDALDEVFRVINF